MAGGGKERRLLAADFVMSFMWVWSSVLIKILVHKILGYGTHQVEGEIVRYVVYLLNMFFFAFMGKITKGGSYNPLTILAPAISGDFSNFLFTVGARIPAQELCDTISSNALLGYSIPLFLFLGVVIGSVYAVRLILDTFPAIGRGPSLNVDIAKGALTEGLLTFAIVLISLGLTEKISHSIFMKTWISSVSKLTLHILGSDLTGGCMNPASVMGWAFANGEHITKEHLIVYWLAPVEATLAAVWLFRLTVRPKKHETLTSTKDETPQLKSGKSD